MESRDFVIKIEKEQMATFATYLTGLLKEAAQPQQESKPAAPELTERQIELLAIKDEIEAIAHRIYVGFNVDDGSKFLIDVDENLKHATFNIMREVYGADVPI